MAGFSRRPASADFLHMKFWIALAERHDAIRKVASRFPAVNPCGASWHR